MSLAQRIQEAARGPEGLRFGEFMEAALYDSEAGFFATRPDRAGRQGDFLTAPEASDAFGAAVAHHLASRVPDPPPARYDLVELGAGRGTLAKQVLRVLDETPLGARSRLHLVERSAAARRAAEDALGDRRVRTYARVDDLPATIAHGALVANELFDNLPVHRVMQTDRLQEIRVRYVRGRFEEHLVDAPADLATYFAEQGVTLRAGQTAEACLEAPKLLEAAVSRFQGGCAVLLFDYGDVAERLYAHDRFPNGTLACHRRHGTDRAYYEAIGQKDLTAHVNFTALARVLEAAGFDVDPLSSQAQFLIDHGLVDRVAAEAHGTDDPMRTLRVLQRAKQLFHPDAMGEAFRVLTAHRPEE